MRQRSVRTTSCWKIRKGLREAAEAARIAGEETRCAAESASHVAMETVQATAEALQTLEHMRVVEEMPRSIRGIREVNNLGSNSATSLSREAK
jgi:hypothetical protein